MGCICKPHLHLHLHPHPLHLPEPALHLTAVGAGLFCKVCLHLHSRSHLQLHFAALDKFVYLHSAFCILQVLSPLQACSAYVGLYPYFRAPVQFFFFWEL